MDSPTIACTKCNAPLSPDLFAAGGQTTCSSCGTLLTGFLFPALSHPTLITTAPEALLTDSEAGCFFHPAKKAVVACESCGRFLCGLCDLDWEGKHLCSTCLESGKKKGKIKTLENTRVLYDHIALSVAIIPALIPFFGWFMTCFSAPVVVFLCLRYWKAPGPIVGRTKFRFVLALVIALVEIGAWVWGIAEIVREIRLHG